MEANWRYRFLVQLCLRLRLSIALKGGYFITTFKLSNNAMAPELRSGDVAAVDTRSAGVPIQAGDMVVASVKCASWDTASSGVPSSVGEGSATPAEEERRLIVRKVAAVAGDLIPDGGADPGSLGVPGESAVLPEDCVFLLANDRSQGPDSRTPGVGPRPVGDILGRVVAVRRRGRTTWL